MLQVNILKGHTTEELTNSVNDFLKDIKTENVKDIKWEMSDIPMIAIVQYELVSAWAGRKCYDCKYWDDGGNIEAVSGLCVEYGGRRRFNCSACECFKDIREVER